MTPTEGRFAAAIAAIDAANEADPNRETFAGEDWPKELLYGRRMTGWLVRLAPAATEELRLAVRAQHLERWKIPRADYAMDRKGYLLWRTTLGRYHAERAGEILRAAGYDEGSVARVQAIIRKEKLRSDPEVQALEDAACLVFLENHFADFAKKHDEAKLVTVLRKTWKKMSPEAHEAALALELAPAARALVARALGEED